MKSSLIIFLFCILSLANFVASADDNDDDDAGETSDRASETTAQDDNRSAVLRYLEALAQEHKKKIKGGKQSKGSDLVAMLRNVKDKYKKNKVYPQLGSISAVCQDIRDDQPKCQRYVAYTEVKKNKAKTNNRYGVWVEGCDVYQAAVASSPGQ